jgi:malate/lactate dehydrogenase
MPKKEVFVSIFGLGNVGATILCMLLSRRDYHFKINIIDPSPHVIGRLTDLEHANCGNDHEIMVNQYQLVEDSQFVFHTAGGKVPKGGKRIDVLNESITITKDVFSKIKLGKKTYVIVVTNPVEIITNYLIKSFPKHNPYQILGTGTLLDKWRYEKNLAKSALVNVSEVKGMVIGEHGQNAIFVDEHSFISRKPIRKVLSDKKVEEIKQQTLNEASFIKSYEGASKYGPSMAAIRIMDLILEPKDILLPVSIQTCDYYENLLGIKTVISIPVKISRHGIYPVRDYGLTDSSISSLKQIAANISHLTP